ncbi:sialin-like [Glandiceps talaboti]
MADSSNLVCFQILARHVLAGMMFFVMFSMYCMRNNLSVTIVAMVNTTGKHADRYSGDCQGMNDSNIDLVDELGEFYWDSYHQGLLLGAYYYGYASSQIFGGWLEKYVGGKIVLGGSMSIASILSLLTPLAARANFWALFFVRLLLGLSQSVILPVHHQLWGKWAPPMERTALISIGPSGFNVGTIFVSAISGVMSANTGWDSVFYMSGGIGLTWVIGWILLGYDSPEKHPRISESERKYIIQEIGPSSEDKDPKVPWRNIFTSLPVWGLVIGHFCTNWGFYTLLTSFPTYLDQVLGFDIRVNGVISALPQLVQWISVLGCGLLADVFRRRKILSTLSVRRTLITIGMYLPAAFLLGAGFVGCGKEALAVALVSIATFFGGAAYPGFKVNHVEIAPRFGGIIYGFTNTIASTTGFAAPYVVGLLTNKANTRSEWLIVFAICATLYVIGGTVLILTIKVDEQDWAKSTVKIYEDKELQADIPDEVEMVTSGKMQGNFDTDGQHTHIQK